MPCIGQGVGYEMTGVEGVCNMLGMLGRRYRSNDGASAAA